MPSSPRPRPIDRRLLLKKAAAGAGAAAIAPAATAAARQATSSAPASGPGDEALVWRSRNPQIEYARLGRTRWMVSRIVAGWCRDLSLHRRLLARGLNYYDTALNYGNYEVELKDFLRSHRDKLFIVSKASDVAGHQKLDEEVVALYRQAMRDFLGESDGDLLALHTRAVARQKDTGRTPDLRPAGRRMARLYTEMLDRSLGRMGIDHVDAYFMHGVEIPWFFDCLEVWEAYDKARQAGKVGHFGFSTHKHAKEVLAAAAAANDRGPWKIDLIMPGVNPQSFDSLKPELAALKKQDVGIIAMKTKGIAGRPVDAREEKFKQLTGGRSFNDWELAKLWMLHLTEGLIDAVIAAMKNVDEMDRTLGLPSLRLSAEAARELRAIVKLQMAGACHLCGACEPVCPERIAVVDMIRYYAYARQYDEKEFARELYARAGCDPAALCTACGRCAAVCPAGVPIADILHALPATLA